MHACHALDCKVHVPPRMHMCRKHWSMVPRKLQRTLWRHYRGGQERDKQPSVEYLEAAAACVRSVAEAEGHDPESIDFECNLYLSWADRLREETTDQLEMEW